MFNLALLVVAVASVAATAWRIAGRAYRDRPWARVLAFAVAACTQIVVLSELLGTFGLLRPLPLTLCALLGAVAVSLSLRSDADSARPAPVRWPALPVWATVSVAVLAAGTLAVSLGRPGTGLDTLQYHYPMVVQWMNTGDLTTAKTFAIANFGWYYPANGNLLQFWAMAWTRSDVLVPLVNWLLLGLLGAAAIGTVRRLGGSLRLGVLAALAATTGPVLLGSQLRSGLVDLAATAFIATALYFALTWWTTEGPTRQRRTDVVFAGLAAGLAAGTKIVTLPYAVALAAVFAVAVLWRWRRRRRDEPSAGREAGAELVLGGAAFTLTGAYFFVRNLLLVGNPLFPSPFAGQPGGWLPVDVDKLGFSVLDYVVRLQPDPIILAAWPAGMWTGGIVAVAAVFVSPVVLWRLRGRTGSPGTGTLAAFGWAVPAMLGLLYVATPTSAGGPWGLPGLFPSNTRYALPFVCTMLVGTAAVLARARPKLATVTMAVIVVTNFVHIGLLAVGAPLLGGELPGRQLALGFVLGGVAVAVAGGLVVVVLRVLRRRPDPARTARPLRGVAAAAGVVAVVAGVAASWIFTTTDRFAFYEPNRLAFALVRDLEAQGAGPQTIAYAGLERNFPLYGTRFGNTVILAAPAAPGPGTAARPFEDRDEFVAWTCRVRPQWFVAYDTSPLAQYEAAGLTDDDRRRIADAIDVERLTSKEWRWALDTPELFRLDGSSGDEYVFAVDADACARLG